MVLVALISCGGCCVAGPHMSLRVLRTLARALFAGALRESVVGVEIWGKWRGPK